MYTIRTMNKIADRGLSLLPADEYQIADDAGSPDAILVRSAKLHDEAFPESLQAIARAGAGVNNIPIDRCSERGIVVFNTPGANANSVKELVLAGMLLASRGIHEGMSWVRENAGLEDLDKAVEKEKKRFAGIELMGKTLGVAGLGAIGVMVSNAAAALGMRVIGFDPFISVESAWGLSRSVERASSLEQLLASCDYITLHVPLNDATKGMIGAEQFAAMKPGSRLLNFARGGLVDDAAVIAALNDGRLARYVTDFPSSDVAGHEGVLALPHLGASTEEAEENCAIMAARQVRDYLERGTIVNSVNFPECRLDATAHQRILIANRNIPNMVGQVTTILANHSINILNLLNRHRGELAYNIIDIDGSVPNEAVEQLRAVDGVIFVRIIQPVLR
ncbi:MAG TPA: phosphoglycerate dehydrogenase [Spirochaetia bacterium]|nr:phosphoglycerate dehydrogenase [Spirochaetia bacterium]